MSEPRTGCDGTGKVTVVDENDPAVVEEKTCGFCGGVGRVPSEGEGPLTVD